MSRKAFAGIKAYYYKKEAALAVLDHAHALRNGFTHSQNVSLNHTHSNIGHYFYDASSCSQALEILCKKHKEVTGKKVRSDCNVLFEHVVWLSEHQYSALEANFGEKKVKAAFMARLKRYAQSVKEEFDFEPVGIDIHFDEGHQDKATGELIRNIHAHVQFMNYSFDKRYAPLRHMMKKGKDEQGRTLQLNQNFERLQDLVSDAFKGLGFSRGVSKSITNREHLKKEDFVKQKLNLLQKNVVELSKRNSALNSELKIQKKKSLLLTEEVNKKQQEFSWLTNQIERLYQQTEELQQAIYKKCRLALNGIIRSTKSFERSNPTIKR